MNPSFPVPDPSGNSAPKIPERGKALGNLAALMQDISKCRADIAKRESLAADLQRRLHSELLPMEEKIIEIRIDTFRILGRHLLSGHLNKRSRKALESALYDLANDLETEYGADLREDRNRFFEEEIPGDRERDFFGADGDSESDPYIESGGNAGAGAYRESDFTHRESDSGRSRQWEKEREHRAGPDSKTKAKQELRDEAITGDIRALYLLLARALHPDKESDPARLAGKTSWMQQVTSAYASRDLARLLDILAANPLDAVGPYLSHAPLKTVQGFAKRLRRELEALRAQLADMDRGTDPVLATFLKGGKLNEFAYHSHLNAVKKDLKFLKQRRDLYRTSQGLMELLDALRTHSWRELL